MTSVSAAADIWSVGCLCLELLTGAPPYFELQPMSALFRIVADVRPPLPDSLSPDLRDFLLLCFHKVRRAGHLCSRCPDCERKLQSEAQLAGRAVQSLLPWL